MPEGAKTCTQWAQAWGITTKRAAATIRRALDAGIMEPVKYSFTNIVGRNVPGVAYREKR